MVKIEDNNMNKFIAEIVLSGNYLAEDGTACYFSKDGLAKLPNIEQEFMYVADFYNQQYDLFTDKTNEKRYIYAWHGDKLYIYNNDDSDPNVYWEMVIPTGNPIILTKID
jgi:hypothetical protein